MKSTKLEWEEAEDVKKEIIKILKALSLPHIKANNIHCFRTNGSKSRAYARIWSMPKIFQRALKLEPHYVIEVLSKYYDNLNGDEKSKVLIHELLHIPNNFSGALVPHRTRSRHLGKTANKLFDIYKSKV
ncbi:MAG: metallopeptidase [Candidatus Levybacteria bacterium CG10_big_fil_rev_8_21_14_0_10_35_13]|nr:MAG: metallopeptidase [Candidatus Levybacteria bacterium CG10_big_fil_rev_8_21_14_0_10_35_13]